MSETNIRKLLAAQKTLVMATISKDGAPNASYAPFVHHDNCFYVYVSALSHHTLNLKESGAASILVIKDEQDSHPFARERLTFPCQAEIVARESDEWLLVMNLFEKKFKKTFVSLIRALADFTLFRLEPIQGSYVAGFGEAYRVNASLNRSRRVTGLGHRK